MGGIKQAGCLFNARLMLVWIRSLSKSLVLAQGEAQSVKSRVQSAETLTQQGNGPVTSGLFIGTSVFYAEFQGFLIG